MTALLATESAAAPASDDVDAALRTARARLDQLASRWRRRLAVVTASRVLAVALPAAMLAARWLARGGTDTGLPALTATRALAAAAVAVVVAVLGGALTLRRPADAPALAAHLDRVLPRLQDSAVLLVLPSSAADLPPLARLQRTRVAEVLAGMPPRELPRTLPWRPLRRGLLALAAGTVVAALLALAPLARGPRSAAALATPRRAVPPPSPLLQTVTLTIVPPSYTGRPTRRVAGLTTTIEEGATLTWSVRANAPVRAARVVLDASETVALAPANGGTLAGSIIVRAPRLVDLRLDGDAGELWRSPLARLDVTPDRPPTVELLAPRGNVERPAQLPGSLAVEAALGDDYGLARAEIVATVAEGAGEDVRFHEHRIPLAVSAGGTRQVVRATLPLAELGFGAERELYVRIEAADRRQPEANVTRSATVVVRAAGERKESAPLGAGIVALAAPELLRSERQIVIDTQGLIAALPRLSRDEAMRRSRDIGLDQRALRLRYGSLLGQEVENGQALGAGGQPLPDVDEAGGPRSPGAAGALGALPEGFVHQHDNAESATFFPGPVREKLRAMLGAMWDAEGALAIGTPRQALPHELVALALLKEVQQADRVYVQQSTSAVAPLDPQRRLTGELEGVRDLHAAAADEEPAPVVQAALATLAALDGGALGQVAAALPELAPALARRARDGSAAALAAIPVLDVVQRGEPLTPGARLTLERALWELVPPPQAPVQRQVADDPLWQRYRRKLAETHP